MKFPFIVLFLVLPFTLFSCGEQALILEGDYAVYGSSNVIAGMSFPPFVDTQRIAFTTQEMKQLAVDRLRIAIDWRNREPVPGEFYWPPLDLRMHSARDNNWQVFLTIASVCPDWAKLPSTDDNACLMKEEAFQAFVEALLRRYDNIAKIQFGNEWEAGAKDGTAYLNRSSVEKFVAYTNVLYDAVQRIAPQTRVVLGGFTCTYPLVEYFLKNKRYPDLSGLDLAHGATVADLERRLDKLALACDENNTKENIDYVLQNAHYDMLDIHLYDDPENWPAYVSVLPKDRPIVVSEFGGPNSEFENTRASYQAERMNAYIDAIEKLPIEEAYYFKLVDSTISYHQDSGLFYSSLVRKPARNVFASRLTPQFR